MTDEISKRVVESGMYSGDGGVTKRVSLDKRQHILEQDGKHIAVPVMAYIEEIEKKVSSLVESVKRLETELAAEKLDHDRTKRAVRVIDRRTGKR